MSTILKLRICGFSGCIILMITIFSAAGQEVINKVSLNLKNFIIINNTFNFRLLLFLRFFVFALGMIGM